MAEEAKMLLIQRKKKAARLIISKENPLTLEHLSRTACCVATDLKQASTVPIQTRFLHILADRLFNFSPWLARRDALQVFHLGRERMAA